MARLVPLKLLLMQVTCPKCRTEIPLVDVNVSTDIALCRRCGTTYSFAELQLNHEETAGVDLARPPRGAWLRRQANEFEVGAICRSWGAIFIVPFTLVWAGGSLSGIYGTQIIHGKFDWFQSLFGIPFLLGSVVLVTVSLMMTLGKVVVRASGDQGAVFVGVGPLGWTRKFRRSEIKMVRLSLSKWRQNERNVPMLELDGPKPIRFGSGLTEVRRNFMLAAVRQYLRG